MLVAVFFTVEARPIVTLILGADYAAAAPGLAILIWALPGSFMADTLLHLLIAQRRQALGTWAVGATALFNVLLNLALIPRFSFLGASAATVASELLCFGLLFAIFRRGVPGVALGRVAWPPVLAGGVTAAALAAAAPRVPDGIPGLALAGAGTLAAYVATLALLGEIGREDVALLRDLLPGTRANGVRVGRGVRFAGRIRINGDPRRITIGDGCSLHRGVTFWTHYYGAGHGEIVLGRRVTMLTSVTLNSWERITVGDDTAFGDGCYVRDNDHGTEPGTPIMRQSCHGAPIEIGRAVWFGARCPRRGRPPEIFGTVPRTSEAPGGPAPRGFAVRPVPTPSCRRP